MLRWRLLTRCSSCSLPSKNREPATWVTGSPILYRTRTRPNPWAIPGRVRKPLPFTSTDGNWRGGCSNGVALRAQGEAGVTLTSARDEKGKKKNLSLAHKAEGDGGGLCVPRDAREGGCTGNWRGVEAAVAATGVGGSNNGIWPVCARGEVAVPVTAVAVDTVPQRFEMEEKKEKKKKKTRGVSEYRDGADKESVGTYYVSQCCGRCGLSVAGLVLL
ncbi:hypothetical protein EDB89DRAFT_1912648 [Lactarius sanguifluus]|nr:hypothetical protein EDB89DRAFT_1912648 [Lactarius sanguifluus]